MKIPPRGVSFDGLNLHNKGIKVYQIIAICGKIFTGGPLYAKKIL